MRFGQRSYQSLLDKRIYKTEMKFWAVLGSWGCRKKNSPTAISMQLFGVIFSTFCGQKTLFIFLEKYFIIRTEKLHSINAKKIFKKN